MCVFRDHLNSSKVQYLAASKLQMADPQPVVVKVAGALKGVVRIRSYDSPVSELRAEVARLTGEQLARMQPSPSTAVATCRYQGHACVTLRRIIHSCRSAAATPHMTLIHSGVSDAADVKLIAGGRTLQDDAKLLRDYNFGPNTRVLVTRGAAAQQAMAGQEAAQRSEEARLAQLDRLKAAVHKMANRGDGRGLSDRYEFSLENQVCLSVCIWCVCIVL